MWKCGTLQVADHHPEDVEQRESEKEKENKKRKYLNIKSNVSNC